MSAVEPFRVAVPQAEIDDLVRRLNATRWPPLGPEDGWSAGADQRYIRRIAKAWAAFDWRAFERKVNAVPNFTTTIEGQTIHFLWFRSGRPGAIPLIMTHGWPSSFLEYLSVARTIAGSSEEEPAFDVVVPSLPGFGFSSIPNEPGMSPRRIASLWVRLMERLGYPRFSAFGCDWGAYVTALIGLDHGDRVDAIQMGYVSLASPDVTLNRNDPAEKAYGERRRRWSEEEFGYFFQQGTKPVTVGLPLNDSPAGLAASILEKWRAWADCGDDPAEIIPMEAILGTLCLYWFTQTGTSAARLYYESRRDPVLLAPGQRVTVPSGFYLEMSRPAAHGKTERTGPAPRRLAEAAFDIKDWTVGTRGGHFPALEVPDDLVASLRAFFGAYGRPAR